MSKTTRHWDEWMVAVVHGFSNRVELGSGFCRIGRPVNYRNIFGEQYIDQSVLGPTPVVHSLGGHTYYSVDNLVS